MAEQARTPAADRAPDPSIGQVVIDDLKQTQWHRHYLREFEDLYCFYVDPDRRAELAKMGRIPRALTLVAWLLKSLFLKLSPARRLLLLLGFVLMIMGYTIIQRYGVDLHYSGFVVLLLVLMLELKDKLLARDEIAVARQVQLALQPSRHPDVPGWLVWSYSRPANDVGGDLVDYIDMGGFRHGIVLGDVAGKGLGAALLTAKLQATLRAMLPDAASLDDLGRRVNAILHADGLDNRYATLFFAQLEHDSGQLRYLNAGHNPPFVIRDGTVERLHPSSYPLGMLATAEYEEGSVELGPGEIMLAYSDGLTEANNENGDEFGIARLEAFAPGLRGLNPDEIGRRVLAEVDRFIGDTRLADDLSLAIVVRRPTD